MPRLRVGALGWLVSASIAAAINFGASPLAYAVQAGAQVDELFTDDIYTNGFEIASTNILQRATVEWNDSGVWHSRSNVDMTQFAEIWGRLVPADAPLPWPGRSGSTARFVIPAGMSVAAKFHVPAGLTIYDAHAFSGNSYAGRELPWPPAGALIGAIFCLSRTPGDFSGAMPYLIGDPQNTDRPFLNYRGDVGTAFYAEVTEGDWYVNIMGIDSLIATGVPTVHY